MVIVGQTAVSAQNLGIERVRTYLLSRGDTFAVEDTTMPFTWYWVNKKEEIVPVRVAVWADSFERSVIYLETERGDEPGVVFSDASYLFYYYLTTQVNYVFPIDGLQNICRKYWEKPRQEIALRHGDSYITSRGIEVPLADAMELPRARKETI